MLDVLVSGPNSGKAVRLSAAALSSIEPDSVLSLALLQKETRPDDVVVDVDGRLVLDIDHTLFTRIAQFLEKGLVQLSDDEGENIALLSAAHSLRLKSLTEKIGREIVAVSFAPKLKNSHESIFQHKIAVPHMDSNGSPLEVKKGRVSNEGGGLVL